MNKDGIIKRAEDFAKDRMKNFDPGHDWWHVLRVRRLAEHINIVEKSADPFILDIAAILHDVSDSKFNKDNGSYEDIRRFLISAGLKESENQVINAISNISFSNRNPVGDLKDPVFRILQDADRLDAIGAIGVARAFSYGSYKGNKLYEPSDNRMGNQGTTIHHFYDKLLKLKDLMNTDAGKELASERHRFLEIFLKQFYEEWDMKNA